MEFDFSEEVLRRALLNIYSRDFHPATEIEINLFNEIWATMDKAAKEGFSKSRPLLRTRISKCHTRNNAVFSAFKRYIVCRMTWHGFFIDSNGIFKTVRQMGTGSLAHCFPSGSSLAADGV